MVNIGYIALDDRPCNFNFPNYLPKGDYNLINLDVSIMGNIKRPAEREKIDAFLLENATKMDYLVLSIDTLIYGGLIPSRLHHDTVEELAKRLDVIKEIRKINPKLKIYAFATIMRCPNTNFDSEEPNYFANYGKKLFEYGRLTHLHKIHPNDKEVEESLKKITKEIPEEVIIDFTNRRKVNLSVLKTVISKYKENYFDFFIIPQDDSAPYGFTSMDQNEIRTYLKENNLISDVLIYPGADEVGMNLIARCFADYKKKKPNIYVYYSSCKGPFVIPCYEDRIIDATIANQIIVSGSQRVLSLPEADILLCINIGGNMLPMDADPSARVIPYDIERNLAELLNYINYAKSLGKVVSLADVSYPSGSDMELINLLHNNNMMLTVDNYASWNTSSNTIGTCTAASVLYFLGQDKKSNLEFLIHRYVDDLGYCTYARTWCDINAALARGYCEAELDGVKGTCTLMTKNELLRYLKENYPEVEAHIKDIEVSSPWNRSFEMDFKIEYR